MCRVSAQSTSIPAVREEPGVLPVAAAAVAWPCRVEQLHRGAARGWGGVITQIVERGWELQIFFDTKIFFLR